MLATVTHDQLALADPLYLMGYYMGQRCLPHRELFLDFVMGAEQDKILLAPREHWKTTTMIGYLVWRILQNPSIRVLIIAHNQDFARDVNKTVRDWLETPTIIRDFGDVRTKHWGKEAFTVRRDRILKEPTCMAAGVGTGILGRHFDLVYCDDILKVENQWTDEQREKLSGWFRGTLRRCCDGEMIITGTRKHIKDLYSVLIEEGTYATRVYRAIIDEDTREVFAPHIWSYERLERERHKMGSTWFAQEMQNEPMDPKGLTLKKEWIKYYDPSKPTPPFIGLYLGIDPAVGKSEVADFTAACLIGVTSYLHYYVLDLQRHRWPVGWVDKVVSLWQSYISRGWRPFVVGVEAIMSGLMQARDLSAAATAMPLRLVDYRSPKDPNDIDGVIPRDKVARIQSLGVYFEQGRVFLPDPNQYPMTITFEHEEYLVFPEGEHDDMLDALNIAILCAPLTGEGTTFRSG